MQQKIYQIDAFADRVFTGNPAAVCPLQEWLPDSLLQEIAMENNLSETAFYVKEGDRYQIRWFTPRVEVDLCGHATLAAAFVLFTFEKHAGSHIHFYSSRSGDLKVIKRADQLTLDFPADPVREIPVSDGIRECFDLPPVKAFAGKSDYLLVYDTEAAIQNLQPHFERIAALPARGIIVTAKGKQVDFVSRFFAPGAGINEDPVTGSAHTTLAPYWSAQLGKPALQAAQLSSRKGLLHCRHEGNRVAISGTAKLYMMGNLFLGE
jgi:PhzF family phenazine biosynthesis protein